MILALRTVKLIMVGTWNPRFKVVWHEWYDAETAPNPPTKKRSEKLWAANKNKIDYQDQTASLIGPRQIENISNGIREKSHADIQYNRTCSGVVRSMRHK